MNYLSKHANILIVVLCALLGLGLDRTSAVAQTASGASSAGTSAGTSDSGDMRKRLRFRIEHALAENGASLGAPDSYHWVFLVQVARYNDSNVRFTDQRRGLQLLLDDLVESRRSLPAEAVADTVSILPYHFNILGEVRSRQRPLRDFLVDASSLKQKVPGQPQYDIYGDGDTYRDGHDWRSAMVQTLSWMKKGDIPVRNAIIVVLDWNDLAQAPQTTADGIAKAGDPKYLTMPQNTAIWKEFEDTMNKNGIVPKNLETVQIGNLEYDMAVFTAENLQPIAAKTPEFAATTTPPPPKAKGSAEGWLLLIPMLIIGALVAKLSLTKHSVRINDNLFTMRALGAQSTLEVLGAQGRATTGVLSYMLPESSAPYASGGVLAVIELNLMGKLQVRKGVYQVKSSRGFKAVPGIGAEMVSASGAFELRDSSDELVTIINIKRQ